MTEESKKKPQKKSSPKIILGALFILSFIMGWILGHQDARFGQVGFTPDLVGKNSQKTADFSIFWQAWELLEKKYDGEIDYQKMIYGAIKGMTEALGDPYTTFLNPQEAQALENELSGTFSGIGAEIGIKNNKITVIAPLDDSPAKKAGLLAGDILTEIAGESTEGMDLSQAVMKIRGEKGSKVKLKIVRGGQPKEFEITRAEITVKSVKYEIKSGKIGYISVSRFDENVTNDLRIALDDLKSKGVEKIIMDLRDNPGGYLDESVTVASQFIEKGVIVSERKDISSGKKIEYKAVSGGKMTDSKYKLVILVNQGSASASEIVAGAIKDLKRGVLVGETTFGKGSVQEIEDLAQGAKIRVTIAHWYTPNGLNIAKEGIKPDFEVKLSDDDFNNDRDPQLLKAMEILK